MKVCAECKERAKTGFTIFMAVLAALMVVRYLD